MVGKSLSEEARDREAERRHAWDMYAAAALVIAPSGCCTNSGNAADIADELLEERDERWEHQE